MAVIHRATLVPSKLELLDTWLARQPWAGGEGELRRAGSYRFDDPDGEVGIEGFLVERAGTVFHLVLTYRGAPLAGAERWLIGTMEHSALGTRWAYDGVGDPAAVAALMRGAAGDQDQAVLEVHDGDAVVGFQEPDVRVSASGAAAPSSFAETLGELPALLSDGPVCEVTFGGATLRVARVLGAEVGGSARLVARWRDGEDVVAALA
ncbi:maltokinase N-terminal cap-like domain-containing protein [Sinomonas sp. G460-2]|uniref:maltokinase N-terminal cap-like domain-containing protein n=1 Tax=Sinomonas sp. G460-2 TaxID=3393464 RepID=UPI0039F00DB9